jgi:hypothetical protein
VTDDIRTNFCVTCKEQADRIEAQAAEIERLREAVDALLQHEASSFFGPDEGKHKRASWRGVIRKAKKARAALGETK